MQLLQCGAPSTTPLHHYQHNPDQAHPNNFYKLTAITITRHLRLEVAALNIAELPLEAMSARCLRATGATALLLSKIDPDLTRLLGRWQLDAMLHYLHVQSAIIKHNLATIMLSSDPTAEPTPLQDGFLRQPWPCISTHPLSSLSFPTQRPGILRNHSQPFLVWPALTSGQKHVAGPTTRLMFQGLNLHHRQEAGRTVLWFKIQPTYSTAGAYHRHSYYGTILNPIVYSILL